MNLGELKKTAAFSLILPRRAVSELTISGLFGDTDSVAWTSCEVPYKRVGAARSTIVFMASLRVAVIYGSVRGARQGIRAVRFVARELKARGNEVAIVDPREVDLPLLDRMYKEYPPDEAPPSLSYLANLYGNVDGFAIVSGEYNHGIPPALSNLLDHFLEEYFWKPALIVSYSSGRFGGVRAAMQLRMSLAEMGMVTIPSLFPIPSVQDAFDEDGSATDESTVASATRAFAEFEWYMRALRQERGAGVPR